MTPSSNSNSPVPVAATLVVSGVLLAIATIGWLQFGDEIYLTRLQTFFVNCF